MVFVFSGKKDDDGTTEIIDIPKRTTPAKGISRPLTYTHYTLQCFGYYVENILLISYLFPLCGDFPQGSS